MRAHFIDEMRWLGSGEIPWSANPGHGSGMKQARKVGEGVRRRECEKRCGRNVSQGVEALVLVDFTGLCREWEVGPHGRNVRYTSVCLTGDRQHRTL